MKLNLRQAAESVQLEAAELKHAAQRGELEAVERGGDWFFDDSGLHEWAQRLVLASAPRRLVTHHKALESHRRVSGADTNIAGLFREESIDLALRSKTKAGVLRDMTDLAAASGLVYDPDALFRGLAAREEAASTAIGAGAAFLHMKELDPYVFEDFFIAYARSTRPVFFGAPDGAATTHFFLVCSNSHERHLHVLARLAVLAHGTDLLERLLEAQSAMEVLDAVRLSEAGMI